MNPTFVKKMIMFFRLITIVVLCLCAGCTDANKKPRVKKPDSPTPREVIEVIGGSIYGASGGLYQLATDTREKKKERAAKHIPLFIGVLRSARDDDIVIEILQENKEAFDLNAREKWGGGEVYPIAFAAEWRRFAIVLFMLNAGVAYQPDTLPGGELQRVLYEQTKEAKPRRFGDMKPAKDNPDFIRVINWLKDRGVKFDKPVPPEESTKVPPPFKWETKTKLTIIKPDNNPDK